MNEDNMILRDDEFLFDDEDEDEQEEEVNNLRKRKSDFLLDSTAKEEPNVDHALNKKQRIYNNKENVKTYQRYFFTNNIGFIKIKKERNDKNMQGAGNREENMGEENVDIIENNETIIEEKVIEIDITSNPLFMKSQQTILENLKNLHDELEPCQYQRCLENSKTFLEKLKKYRNEIDEVENEEHKKFLNDSSNSLVLERSNSFRKLECIFLNEEERVMLSILFSDEVYSLDLWNKLNDSLSTQIKEKLEKYGFLVGMLHRILKKNFNKFKGLAFKWGNSRRKGPFTLMEESNNQKEDSYSCNPNNDNNNNIHRIDYQKEYSESIMSNCYHLCSQDPRAVIPASFFECNLSDITPQEITSEKGILYVFQCQNAAMVSNIKKNDIAQKLAPNQITENDVIIPPRSEFRLVHSSGDSNIEFRQMLKIIFKTPIPPTLDICMYRETFKEETQLHLEQIIVDSWNGSREAQCKLGSYYFWGKEGLQKSYEKAYVWLLRAALQGHPVAQNSIGAAFYQKGVVVPRDHNIAFEWFSKAAAQGNTKAQYNLALLYRHGRGVTRDYQMALYWYTVAASKGHVAAKNNIGYLYEHGYGVTKNYEEALKWYLRAAFMNNTKAQFNVGCFLLMGKGSIPKDPHTAREWLRKAASEGDADAKRLLNQRF